MVDPHWLMNAQVLRLLRTLRKRLQAEFGLRLRLAAVDLEQQLARAKSLSVDNESKRIIGLLEELRGAPFLSGDEPAPRLYRGHPVLQEPKRDRDIYALIYAEERFEAQPPKYWRGRPLLREFRRSAPKSRLIYRGRRNDA